MRTREGALPGIDPDLSPDPDPVPEASDETEMPEAEVPFSRRGPGKWILPYSINQVSLVGRCGAYVDYRLMEIHGYEKLIFSLCTTDRWISKTEGRLTKLNWHKCVAVGELARRFGEHMEPGRIVSVVGKLVHNNFEGRDGKVYQKSDVYVQSIQFMDRQKWMSEKVTPGMLDYLTREKEPRKNQTRYLGPKASRRAAAAKIRGENDKTKEEQGEGEGDGSAQGDSGKA